MVLVGAVVLPHGTSIFDGDEQTCSAACAQRRRQLPAELRAKLTTLYEGCLRAGREVAALGPDLVVLHTPHGISLTHSFGVYISPAASGNALWNDTYDDIKVTLPLDMDTSLGLVTAMRAEGLDAEGIRSFSNMDAPLRWGEVVPAWFIQHCLKNPGTKYLILSQSLQLMEDGREDDRVRIGDFLFRYLHALPANVVFAVSGDLSHVHTFSNVPTVYHPFSGSNFVTNDEAAKAMDQAVEDWVKSADGERDSDKDTWRSTQALIHLKRVTDLRHAYACGLTGFWIAQGLLQKAEEHGLVISSRIHAREAPVYFGMMAALFVFRRS